MARIESQQQDVPTSTAVVEAVSETAGADPTALPPLYEVIDPDALDRLLDPSSRTRHPSTTVEFVYYGYVVTITSINGVSIRVDNYDVDLVEQ